MLIFFKRKNVTTYAIGGFGIARGIPGPHSIGTRGVGTLLYIVSEVSSGYPYTEKTDMYTLGCVMYKILGKSTKPELQKYEERPQLLRNQFGGVVPK